MTLDCFAVAESDFCFSPGRLFVAAELKCMLAHVLMNYDIKMANDAGRPDNIRIGQEMLPDATAEVLFRKRV